MKPNLTTFLTLILITIFSFQLKGQDVDMTRSETILKLENPYKKNRTKWLNENGFNTQSYTWDDPAINLYLDKAVKNRSAGNVLAYTSGGIIAFGLFANFAGRLAYEISNNDPDRQFHVFKGPYYLGGALAASSIVFHINAHAKLKKAKKARVD